MDADDEFTSGRSSKQQASAFLVMLKKIDWISLLFLIFLGLLGWMALHHGVRSTKPDSPRNQIQRHL
jgi:hypothetical protein